MKARTGFGSGGEGWGWYMDGMDEMVSGDLQKCLESEKDGNLTIAPLYVKGNPIQGYEFWSCSARSHC